MAKYVNTSAVFHSEDIWERIQNLIKKCKIAYVAVPYVGRDACEILKLPRGSILVVRFDIGTIKSGATCPHEILKYINRGVKVYQAEYLHAKVMVFGSRAIIGSANISNSSFSQLIEAGIEIKEIKLVKEAKEFIEDLRGDQILPSMARKMMKYYNKAKKRFKNKRRVANAKRLKHSNIVIVPLEYSGWDEKANKASRTSKKFLKARHMIDAGYKVSQFEFDFRRTRYFKENSRVQQVVDDDDGKKWLEPLGRVKMVKPFMDKDNDRRIMVSLEVPRIKARRLKRFTDKYRSIAKHFNRKRDVIRVAYNEKLLENLGKFWV